jgi:tetratricopeptide (TPR) repeat protein
MSPRRVTHCFQQISSQTVIEQNKGQHMRFLTILLLALPTGVFAAGSDSDSSNDKPDSTETTEKCDGDLIWNGTKCVTPRSPELNENDRLKAIQELAFFGDINAAQQILRQLDNPTSDLALTYWGFTHRKQGNLTLANLFYQDAIDRNPDNILARSYMGQGFVEAGKMDAAIAQWQAINSRDGADSWAARSLESAIRTGLTYNY